METREKHLEPVDSLSDPRDTRDVHHSARGPLGRVMLIAFIGYTSMYFVVFFYALLVAAAFIPPILIEASLTLLATGIVALRWRWAPYLGALIALLTLYDPIFQPHDLYVFTHPGQSNYEFSLIISVIAFGLVALVACIATILRSYRKQNLDAGLPRFAGGLLSGVAGFVVGMIALSLIVTIVPQAGVAGASTNNSSSQATVHLTINKFAPDIVVVPKGKRLLLVNDTAVEHILQNGTWKADGSPQPGIEAGAPALHSLSITNGSQEIGPFTNAGVYHIYCTVHVGMNLTIVVE